MATKPVLVLVPGLGADAGDWPHQSTTLRTSPTSPWPTYGPVHRALRWPRPSSAVPGPFALAGHSMGGWVAQEAAARAPQRVTRLALLNTWARPDAAVIAAQR